MCLATCICFLFISHVARLLTAALHVASQPYFKHILRMVQVVMTDSLQHCSRPNLSARTRAAWMPQFSAQPIRYRAAHGGAASVSLAIAMNDYRR